MSEPSIRLQDVSLRYRLAKQRIPSIKEFAIHWMRGALVYEDLWALRDVSFEVRQGETVGIVGRNGAGKSTLLKVISRVLKPSRGRIEVRGRIAPILELGTGFDHELTGLENIHLNALLLGRSRREIEAKLEEIIDFSGLGDFIRSPIRNYSSGMLARLGFSIATVWMPEILILDEVLSVGDSAFIDKCLQRLSEFHAAGTTVLMVSHIAKAVQDNCDRCIWLDAGRLRADGPTRDVLDQYAHAGTDPDQRAAGQLHLG